MRIVFSLNRLTGASFGLGKANTVVRWGSSSWVVRLDSRSDDWLHIVLANVSHQDIKHSLLVGRFGDNLAEAGVNVEEELDIEVILITTTMLIDLDTSLNLNKEEDQIKNNSINAMKVLAISTMQCPEVCISRSVNIKHFNYFL